MEEKKNIKNFYRELTKIKFVKIKNFQFQEYFFRQVNFIRAFLLKFFFVVE